MLSSSQFTTRDRLRVPLSRPDITELEIRYINEVLRSPHLSLGPKLQEFEEKMAEYVGTRYAVAVNSGTSGLHLAVKSLGIGKGDIVITTPFSFIASANVILYVGATPLFVDIEPKTLNIDVDKMEAVLEENRGKILQRTKAILAVHIFGHPCEMKKILELAKRYNLQVIEDACEALGAEYTFHQPSGALRSARVGSLGKVGVFAFYPNKQITTGEGGVIVTDDEKVADMCKSLRNQGRGKNQGWLLHERLGYNYRLSDINCALGIAQLERIEEILRKREQVARMYNERLEDLSSIQLPTVSEGVKMSWFVYVIRLGKEYTRRRRDWILRRLKECGIGCNSYFTPIHLQPFYAHMFSFKKGDFPVTEEVSDRTVALPFFNQLEEEKIDYVVRTLKKLLRDPQKKR